MLTVKRIRDLLSTGSFESPLTYVLLDMQCLYGQEQDAVSKQVLHLLKLLETHTWAGIIIGGYGIPDQISTAVATKEQGYLRRMEQDVFRDAAAYDHPPLRRRPCAPSVRPGPKFIRAT